ncbi:DNA-binding transcriptional regulator, MerR family [Nonomuraea maritima]|uniref:DNA-binding transcriptional regulator, MerR family n=1 Tax=Nonomuraea maritima TaxID=683260 RepID=A0A1G9B7M1_9ACTN|nr:MerR family transcriptional regulator [Nonomuraea maritima]SDK35040.1 DNA-binding transcriptional regulator, MerR family [Nonomuraea maritima]
MNADTLYSIGDLARRTGLTVKTIRFYSDQGIVPPADRTPAGYRRYGPEAAARLDLVRTLRDLGLDLATIRRIVNREVPLARVAAVHAEALRAQIRTLRRRQAVLAAVARRGSTPEEMEFMHELAGLTQAERHHLITDFLDAVLTCGHPGTSALAGIRVSLTPEPPDDPEPELIEAWIELAELSRDPEFRADMRRTAELHAADRATGGVPRPDAAALVRDAVGPVLAAGVDPAAAAAVVAEVCSRYAREQACDDGPELRARLLERLETVRDPRRDRYMELLATVNGWPAPVPLTPALTWFVEALRARPYGPGAAAAL